MLHDLKDQIIALAEFIHAEFIIHPEKDQQGAGDSGGKAYHINQKVAPGTLYVAVNEQ
jgi:hypothetical protein